MGWAQPERRDIQPRSARGAGACIVVPSLGAGAVDDGDVAPDSPGTLRGVLSGEVVFAAGGVAAGAGCCRLLSLVAGTAGLLELCA